MAGRVVCVGDVMIDVLAQLPGPLALGSDTPADITLRHGGSAANTAAWLAAADVPAAFVGRIGEDTFGESAQTALEDTGLEVHLVQDRGASTGTCIVLVGPDGERTMIPSPGANARLASADVVAAMAAGDWLHLSAYPLLRAESSAQMRAVLDVAATTGLPISVDAASAAPLLMAGAGEFLSWLPNQTLLIANVDEARTLTGLDNPRAAAEFLGQRVARVVVKHSAQGAYATEEGAVTLVPTEPVEVLDSTGAGDAFAAGLLGALLDGTDLVTAVATGHQFGALAVAQVGARPSVDAMAAAGKDPAFAAALAKIRRQYGPDRS